MTNKPELRNPYASVQDLAKPRKSNALNEPKQQKADGDFGWILNALLDMKFSAEAKGYKEIAKELEVSRLRIRFLMECGKL